MERRTLLSWLPLLPAVLSVGCDDDCETKDENGDSQPCSRSPTEPTPPPPPPRVDTIEFRVIGSVNNAEVRSYNPLDGLQETNAALPWVYSYRSLQDNVFLSLSARGVSRGFDETSFIQVQIVINGVIFREASGFGFDPTAQISGTYRRS